MKILIVGGAGYVGGYVTDLLKETNNEIIVYDNLLYENQFQKDVKFVFGDIRDYKKIQQYFDWADTVVWMAALVGDGACSINPVITNQVNFVLRFYPNFYDSTSKSIIISQKLKEIFSNS